MSKTNITAPQKLATEHVLEEFDSGEPSLDEWLRRRAQRNETDGASRTYVICEGLLVVGYYALAAGAIAHQGAPGSVRRNMPDPIPVMVLGRLAIDKSRQGQGLGRALLRDAVLRTLAAGDIVGIRAVLVHAISPAAKAFYEANGFRPSPLDPMTLMITCAEARKIVLEP